MSDRKKIVVMLEDVQAENTAEVNLQRKEEFFKWVKEQTSEPFELISELATAGIFLLRGSPSLVAVFEKGPHVKFAECETSQAAVAE